MFGIWNLLQIILLLIVAIYVLVPLLVRSKQWFSTQPEITEIDEQQMSKTSREYCTRMGNKLGPLGFEKLGDVRVRNFCEGQESFVRVFANAQKNDVAIATEIVQNLPNGKTLGAMALEFNTEFSDGSELSVSNSDIAHQPGMCANNRIIPIPGEEDLDSLYRLYSELKIYYGKGDRGRTLHQDRIVEEIRDSMLMQMNCSVENGYLYINKNKHQYRLTLKGAYINTLSHMWPFKQMRQSVIRKKAHKLMSTCKTGS